MFSTFPTIGQIPDTFSDVLLYWDPRLQPLQRFSNHVFSFQQLITFRGSRTVYRDFKQKTYHEHEIRAQTKIMYSRKNCGQLAIVQQSTRHGCSWGGFDSRSGLKKNGTCSFSSLVLGKERFTGDVASAMSPVRVNLGCLGLLCLTAHTTPAGYR